MSFVPVKGLEQQALSMLHSARSQLINGVRGHLSELGIIAERGLLGLGELAAIVRDESDQRLLVVEFKTVDAVALAIRAGLYRLLVWRLGAAIEVVRGLGALLAGLGRLHIAVLLGQGEDRPAGHAAAVERAPLGRAPIRRPLVNACPAPCIPLRETFGATAAFVGERLANFDAGAVVLGRDGFEWGDKALKPGRCVPVELGPWCAWIRLVPAGMP
jgi:hypothetical protein